ncbi:hypothetical protein Q7689_03640 [Nocardiopsis tropica]|uniref:hypothetical protein n=1 Tax=Nocardiopsis tropica TaxID=109330 RepID=UPI002E891A8F|nr:hypothetical protein [Nocardiopsis tropica]
MRKIYGVLSMILDSAVASSRVAVNVATDAKLPRLPASEHVYLNHRQVEDLASAAGEFRTFLAPKAACSGTTTSGAGCSTLPWLPRPLPTSASRRTSCGTAASLAIASGADVKVVQMMLGHTTATMALDHYGHLFPDRLDEVAEQMAAGRAAALAKAA